MNVNVEPDSEVVAIVYRHNAWTYYVTEDDVWVMDWVAWKRAFALRGFAVLQEDSADRFAVQILNEDTADQFFAAIADCAVSPGDLRDTLRRQTSHKWDDVQHLFPTVFADFDNKRLYSAARSGIGYEHYVAPDWVGSFEDFYERIPSDYQYWIDGNVNYLRRASDDM